MYKTESEILSQCDALKQTAAELERARGGIRAFFNVKKYSKFIFTGCGSSYCVAKSAAAAMTLYGGVPSYAVSSGDLFLNAGRYAPQFADAALVSFSRSGATSEVRLAVEKFLFIAPDAPYLSVCETAGSVLSKMAGLSVELPWAYDESVCQTRSVSNMYLAGIALSGILSGDSRITESLQEAIDDGDEFINTHGPEMKRLAAKNWDRAVVLADGELEGIGEEAALAFKEICMVPSNYYHFMDVRHGPIVLIDEKTLVLAAFSPGDSAYQSKLIDDLKQKRATVIALCDENQTSAADYTAHAPRGACFAAYGLPLVFLAQLVAFHKALLNSINPDEPNGLAAWIAL